MHDESKWKDNFQEDIFYSHVSSISFKVLNGLFGFESSGNKSQVSDTNGHILVVDVIVTDESFTPVNLYNSNMQIEQTNSLMMEVPII